MNKKTMNIILIIIGVGLVGWFLYSWLPVRNIEEPKYTTVSEASGYEIREYASYIVAETTVSGAENRDEAARKGFPIIAGYIFGDNTKKDKIAMTVPVNTEKVQESNTYKISFVMPSKYTLETLPEPNDKRVELREVPAHKVAVRRFSWTTSESAFKKHEAELLEALRRDRWRP